MSSRLFLLCSRVLGAFALALAFALSTAPARANVYATSIKLNSVTNDVTLAQGESLSISYILNEAASLGVKVSILSGTNAVRTIQIGGGELGSQRGLNIVEWDAKTDGGAAAPTGTYSVNVNPVSSGYTNWTQITDDENLGNRVWEGRGIAVNRNPSSPFYGRVFVSNARTGQDPASVPGDNVGIIKLNADGTPADEGAFSTGGHEWAGDFFSPWHIEVSDDEVYVEDWTPEQGRVYRWDSTLDTNSIVNVLREDNWSPQVVMAGPAIHGSGTNKTMWMADYNTSGPGRGIIRFKLLPDGTCATNDVGVSVVGVGGDLTLAPYDVALDKDGNIYTCQFRTDLNDPDPRVMRFPAYDPSTNSNTAQTVAQWSIGAGDNTMGQATGIAVDETGTYVAVAFQGVLISAVPTNGCVQVFYATNGVRVANVDLGLPGQHQDTDCAWDAVGNLYTIDNWAGRWRAFSPPGTNQSTTAALYKVTVSGSSASQQVPIKSITLTNGMVTLVLVGTAGDSPTSYKVQGATNVEGPYAVVAAATITAGSVPGEFVATLPVGPSPQFLRAMKAGSTPPPPTGELKITEIALAAGNATILFTGSTNDIATMFKVMGAPQVTGTYAQIQAAVVTQTSPGNFKAVVPATLSGQFYKIAK